MAIGRISGSVLKSNLTRNGVDLAFETNLLYLDVTNSRVGIGTSEPTTALQVNGTTTTTGLTASGAIAANGSGNSITVADTLRIAQSGSGLRMTNVGAFDNDGSDNFRIFSTNDLILSSNGDSNTALTIDKTTQNVTINQDLGVTGTITTSSIAGLSSLAVDGVTITDNTITTNASNADLELDASGTGNVVLKTSANFIQGSAHTISSEDATGTYKARQYLMWGETTDATETEIFVGGVTNARIPVGTNTTINYSVQVVARRTDTTGESAAWELKALADSFSGTVANVGNVYEVIVARDDGTWLVDARADDANNSVGIYVTGAAGKTIRWVAEVETSEVSE